MIGTRIYKPLEPDTLTRTVMHEVTREVAEQEAVLDENGGVIGYKPVTKTITEEVPKRETYDNPSPNTYTRYREATQWCNANRAYIDDKGEYYEVCALPEPTTEEIAVAELANAKAERAAAVAALAVEVDGMVFDGDEKAQERMARAVLMAESPEESMEWVLADSSVAVVTAEQLRRACRAAGKAQGALWTKPYQD